MFKIRGHASTSSKRYGIYLFPAEYKESVKCQVVRGTLSARTHARTAVARRANSVKNKANSLIVVYISLGGSESLLLGLLGEVNSEVCAASALLPLPVAVHILCR
jgi:hypothetical protein